MIPPAVYPKLPGTALAQTEVQATVVDAYLAVAGIAFLAALILTPVMRRLALHNGVVDLPDARRKNHSTPVAYLGGVAIFFGWLAGVMAAFLGLGSPAVAFPLSIVLGAAAITLTGLIDDVYGIAARVKIGGQLMAAAALASQDVGTNIAISAFENVGFAAAPGWLVYWSGALLIGVLVVGGCNAVNLIDGLDGLASGVVGVACVGFLICAAIVAGRIEDPLDQHAIRIVMALACIGAVIGFLPYNFRPASIFMGDAGSLLLGFLCIASILLFAEVSGPQPLRYVTACLIIFLLPISDASLAIIRRKLSGQPIFAPDAMHLHHMLRRSGLSVVQSVLVMYGLAIFFAGIGVSLLASPLRWRYLLLAFGMLFLLMMVAGYKYSLVVRSRETKMLRDAEPAVQPGLAPFTDALLDASDPGSNPPAIDVEPLRNGTDAARNGAAADPTGSGAASPTSN
ncbi:MAG: MraY family glycosyltransferase [Planctomycetota bacterium]